MECPHCGKMSDEVIDSRPIKEGLAIRRRRRCLVCQGRFTTYEATEDQLPFVLMKKGPGQGGTVTHVKTVLTFASRTLKAMMEEMTYLIERVDKLEKIENDEAPYETASVKNNRVLKKPASRRTSNLTATDRVLRIIRRHRRGVDIGKLKATTGYDDGKIGNILYRANKEGKIRRVSRGVYVAAK